MNKLQQKLAELLDDRGLWGACRASRKAMERAYKTWQRAMADFNNGYCSALDQLCNDGEDGRLAQVLCPSGVQRLKEMRAAAARRV